MIKEIKPYNNGRRHGYWERYLKSGIRDSESIENLSPIAENLYYRLLVTVDDFGRYDARPAMIKAACFPIKDSINATKTEALLKELAQHGLIEIYVEQDKPFLQMTKWDNIPRAKESKYPANPHDATQVYADVCNSHTDVPLTKTETETKTETKTAPEGVFPEPPATPFLKPPPPPEPPLLPVVPAEPPEFNPPPPPPPADVFTSNTELLPTPPFVPWEVEPLPPAPTVTV